MEAHVMLQFSQFGVCPSTLPNHAADGSFLFALAATASRPKSAVGIFYFQIQFGRPRVVKSSVCASCHQSSGRLLYKLHCLYKLPHVDYLFALS